MKRKFGLRFFKPTESYSGNWSILEEKDRTWEDMYRGRWSHDKVVRTTHGVNCTGSCSWKVFVKNGIITWENQQIDYPSCGPDMPEFEPRGCPRGASIAWGNALIVLPGGSAGMKQTRSGRTLIRG